MMYIGLGTWIAVGAIAGWIVNALTGGQMRGGCCGLVLLGMVGAVIGGMIFQALGGAPVTGVNVYSIVVALVGALVLLWLVKMVKGK
jgi:uncharacterized membrane protein YeaQ/YmgE (transglycosylase-associated protein family)